MRRAPAGRGRTKKAQEGKQAREMGLAFERWIRDDARRNNILLIKQQEQTAPTKYTDQVGVRLWRLVGAGWPDWVGCLSGGRFVTFESKATIDPVKWPVSESLRPASVAQLAADHKRGRQARCLQAARDKGAPAFVLVRRLKPHVEDYVIPVEALTFSSRVWSKLARWKVPLFHGWIDAVECWERYVVDGWSALDQPDPPMPEPEPEKVDQVELVETRPCVMCGSPVKQRPGRAGRPRETCGARCRKARSRQRKREQLNPDL